MSRKNIYGWTPDIPDKRDLLYKSIYKKEIELPSSIDLSPVCSPVEDQATIGSCTANALVGNLEYLMIKNKKPYKDLSRLFLYYNERVYINTVKVDSGAMLRDGIKSLVKQGVCTESKWPYIPKKFTKKPLNACYKEALNYQVLSYMRLNSLYDMRYCLASGFPFVFGFAVYKSFETKEVATTGTANMPLPGEESCGGHAVLCVGYNDLLKRFIVRNSWGLQWGKKGHFTIPYEYLKDRSLSDDFWTIRTAENM